MRTMKLGLAAAGAVVMMISIGAGTAAAGPRGKQIGKIAAKSCKIERKAMGKEAFAGLYGKPAMRNCIGVTKPEVRQAKRHASRDCRAERDELGVEAFREQYGTNGNKRNAFGKCVSKHARSDLRKDRADSVNAAKACKAERNDPAFADSHDGKTFAEYYGKNKNGRNAFGKCVSAKDKAADEEPAPQAG